VGVDRCDFDVDGDGTYEVSETDCVATWTYEERGTYDASVLVVAGDRTDTAARSVTVSDAPTATLSYDPAGPTVGEAATRRFDDPGVYEFHRPDCGLVSVCGAVVVGDATLADPPAARAVVTRRRGRPRRRRGLSSRGPTWATPRPARGGGGA
jgi:hypothetical protein